MLRWRRHKSAILLIPMLLLFALPAAAGTAPRIKAVAFDAFPIFDPRPLAAAAETAFPGQGKALMEIWRTRLFEYQWLRALAGQYKDFMDAAEASLVFATEQMGLPLSPETKDQLLQPFSRLSVWPDVPEAVQQLRAMGVELVFLSNMTEPMLRNGLHAAGLEDAFRAIYSTDLVQTYKPAPEAYALAVGGLGLKKEEILFAAFAGWDVAGAKWFGYPTFWVNRLGAPSEALGVTPDGAGQGLKALVEFIATTNGAPAG